VSGVEGVNSGRLAYRIYRFPCRILVASPFYQVFKAVAAAVISDVFNSFDPVFFFAIYLNRWGRLHLLAREGIRFRSCRSENRGVENRVNLNGIGQFQSVCVRGDNLNYLIGT
jgi:hypothetical protein